jgi:hypothetical protein
VTLTNPTEYPAGYLGAASGTNVYYGPGSTAIVAQRGGKITYSRANKVSQALTAPCVANGKLLVFGPNMFANPQTSTFGKTMIIAEIVQ